jgi:hypothetical protein
MVLLGGLAWFVTQAYNSPETSGSEDTSSTEEAAPSTVQVPALYYASEAESTLTDAGLKLGNQSEASNDTVTAGVVIEQDPTAGTTVEEGTAVDIVVSTGPKQITAPIQAAPQVAPQAAPTPVGVTSQQAPTVQAVSTTTQSIPASATYDNKKQKGKKRAKEVTGGPAPKGPVASL